MYAPELDFATVKIRKQGVRWGKFVIQQEGFLSGSDGFFQGTAGVLIVVANGIGVYQVSFSASDSKGIRGVCRVLAR